MGCLCVFCLLNTILVNICVVVFVGGGGGDVAGIALFATSAKSEL